MRKLAGDVSVVSKFGNALEATWHCNVCLSKGKRWLRPGNARRGSKEHMMKFHPEKLHDGIIIQEYEPEIIVRRKRDGEDTLIR